MVIGAGATIGGGGVILDSTYATRLDPTAKLNASAITLDSGQISLQLTNPGDLTLIDGSPTAGLVLTEASLKNLQATAHSISLLSYSSLDIYGTGAVGELKDGVPTLGNLAVRTGEIRGFNNNGGAVAFFAQDILLDNSAKSGVLGPVSGVQGSLEFHANTIELGVNQLNVDQYESLSLDASKAVLGQGVGGLATAGDLTITTPLLTGKIASNQTIKAAGDFKILTPVSATQSDIVGGLGARLSLIGSSLDVNTEIAMPSGILSLRATAGDLSVGDLSAATLDVGGNSRSYFDVVKYTNGGQINLAADQGKVQVAAGSSVSVAAQSGGGDAGTLNVSAPEGSFVIKGNLLGQGGANGIAGSFSLDSANFGVSTISASNDLSDLERALNAGSFSQSQSIRIRGGLVDGISYNDVLLQGATLQTQVNAHQFSLSADQGAIAVSGVINASGDQGGTINLIAHGGVTLLPGALLTVAGDHFSHAGKGGSVSLEAGAETNGAFDSAAYVDIQSGAAINLSVASNTPDSAALGNYTGVLHLRAPQLADSSDLQVKPIAGQIIGASRINVEGYTIFTPANGSIDSAEADVTSNGVAFTGNSSAIATRLLASQGGVAGPLGSLLHIQPGAEIISLGGDLTLTNDWDLSTYRFGPNADPGIVGSGEAGVLTLRAAGNLVFQSHASLSDGFGGNSSFGLWDAMLLAPGSESWSYRLVSGGDFSAANFRDTNKSGSLLLGLNTQALPTSGITTRNQLVPSYFQTIRTGIGSIDIFSGNDVQLLNPLATIYTAGSQAPGIDNFDTPRLAYGTSILGPVQSPIYPAQYSLGGGDVAISAKNDIAHYVLDPNGSGKLVADSSKELPTNWLYRRSALNASAGFANGRNGDVASTSWWIDFSNFFEGVGALGGGNVTLTAGQNITNVDAFVPTNARMTYQTTAGDRLAAHQTLYELGGGDLKVKAGRDVDGGVYYVERGRGVITAGNSIHSNATRAAISQDEASSNQFAGITPATSKWLPTSLFLGKGSFDLSASGDILIGPMANPFLLPAGINNGYFNKSYFSTYASTDQVTATSLVGSVSIKNNTQAGTGSLIDWYHDVFLSFQNGGSFGAASQPWLRLAESQVSSYNILSGLMPPTLQVTAFSGDINLVGSLTLVPSATGDVSLLAGQSINGVQITGHDDGSNKQVWASSLINLSDADPNRLPSIFSPISSAVLRTNSTLVTAVNSLFAESGATTGNYAVIQTKQALHGPGPLHLNDPNPVQLYALGGDISGMTLFAGKFSRILAGEDITDVSLYLQNTHASDVSVVSSGRDLIAFDPNSQLRQAAQTEGNQLAFYSPGFYIPASGSPTAGDIQISGPGTIEVLAGRSLDLGVGPNSLDGTGLGLTSIGNARNPALPFAGADIVAGAGTGFVGGPSRTPVDFTQFIAQFITDPAYGTRYLSELGPVAGVAGPLTPENFSLLTAEEQQRVALAVFYLVLRDSGRDHNDPASPGFGTYSAGLAAVAALFPSASPGDISLTSREIKTKNGGSISVLAPGGQVNVGLDLQATDQGILTEGGGAISVFADGNVSLGRSRIFTLRGGDIMIWSSGGNIAAGSSAKTVQSAPPTRVLIDPQSGDLATDLSGLSTGGGIGVLATVAGLPPGNVDLIAPVGAIDAGDAGIRTSGNLNLAAVQVINASNIQAAGVSAGVPVAAPSAPSLGGLTSAPSSTAATNSSANEAAQQQARNQAASQEEPHSIITVEVIGYGGGEG